MEDINFWVCFQFQNGMKVAEFMYIYKVCVALSKICILKILNLKIIAFTKLTTLFFCKILQQDIHYEMANFITVFYTHASMYMHAHTKHHVSLQKNWKGLECSISKT